MKKFNEVIQVEVSVDIIAHTLLSKFAPDEKHAELIAETVVGTLLNGNSAGISQLYNALNGYTNEIDFEVGDEVICDSNKYSYIDGKQEYVAMGEAVVTRVDIYRKNKLFVTYDFVDSDGELKENANWVSHMKCDKVVYGDDRYHS